MRNPTLNSIVIGFTEAQHSAVVRQLRSVHVSLRVNEASLKPDVFGLFLRRSSVDIVFLKYNSKANFIPLFKKLRANNKDCIIVELVDPTQHFIDDDVPFVQVGLQKCRLIHSAELREFHLALQFVMQYVILKKDFRRCKSLLNLSESRVLKLVDSSNHAIAFVAEGQFIHANIPFLVMFSAESIAELKRFSLRKLIDSNEHEIFAKYLANVAGSSSFNADLVLSMRRTSGAPFNAKIQVSPVVSKGRRCFQIWIEQRTQSFSEEVIPVTKTLNIWDMPVAQVERVEANPFDGIVTVESKADGEIENSLDVLQRELLADELVKLRFRELHDPRNRGLNSAWVKLDVEPENFRMVNALLSRNAASVSTVFASFWDHLMFKLVLDLLSLETLSQRNYLVTLSVNSSANTEMMVWLYRQLKRLGKASKQLTFVIDADIPMNRIPQMNKIISLLKKTNCHITFNNFSVDTTPLFLFKSVKPSQVILDSQWVDEIKNKNDNGLFIKRFVRKLESLGVSVLVPQSIQKDQDRLFVLTGASIGQEIPTQDCA
jgi:hypothetical protein